MYKAITIALTLITALLIINTTQAADEPTTVTVPVVIDGITRTATVVISGTDVLSVTVAPISDTFETTATAWLEELYSIYADVAPTTVISATALRESISSLLSLTDDTAYPQYWTPFVRQFRFAIHTCASFLDVHNQIAGNEDGYGLVIGIYFDMHNACVEQYQDAYVEMERTVHYR